MKMPLGDEAPVFPCQWRLEPTEAKYVFPGRERP
jgi:hypothetical protein